MKTKRLICPDGKVYLVDARVDKHGLNGYTYHVIVRCCNESRTIRFKTFNEALSYYMKLGKEQVLATIAHVSEYEIDIREEN